MVRTELTRERHRARHDRSELDALLDAERVGHVAIVIDGEPLVVPTLIARDGDQLLLHGSVGSHWMREASTGTALAVEVTRVEGIIVARSGFESSIRFRSCVLFGQAVRLRDEESLTHALTVMVEKILPGRTAELRPPTPSELRQTMVLALPIATWSLKVSDGWPADEPEERAQGVWAGVVTLAEHVTGVLPSADVLPGVPVPKSVMAVAARART